MHTPSVESTTATVALLPLRSGSLFPGTTLSLPVGRSRSVALLDALGEGATLAVVAQRDPAVSDPGAADLNTLGTLCRVVKLERSRDRGYRVVLEGVSRWRLNALVGTDPYLTARGETVAETDADPVASQVLARSVREHAAEVAQRTGGSLTQVTAAPHEPGRVADQVASLLGLSPDKELAVLAETDVHARLQRVAGYLAEARTLAELKTRIDQDVRKEVGKHQREAMLREQIRALKRELGEGDGGDDATAKLRARLEAADLPEEVRAVATRELGRLETLGQSAESHVVRNYLENIADLPWRVRAEAKDDLNAVAERLDADHTGLEDVKRRILEHMAVLKLSGSPRGTVLCLAGPPGVGKTSLGQSIADATGRPFVRIALGGVRDEAEIRGHRRTYVGALPGRIVQAMKKAKVRNPVVLLDEVDKLFSGWGGSPEAALLEVLDPEQNKTFTDHYLELPFDLSEAIFIATVNDLSALSAPLRDRLEVIELQGYTADEKVAIARNHLLPKHLKEHAVPEGALRITDAALQAMVRDYTREAGVRQLGRTLTKVCRRVALDVARAPADSVPAAREVDVADLVEMLGRPKFFSEVAERTAAPGVATGLAWTPVGGDILFVETSRMPGKGSMEITGQLGDVMKESARAALTYVRANAATLGVDADTLASVDLHLHVPAGAVPKDGPSAGVTIFTALTSLLTGRRVRPDTAMTGEVSLRGRVLPVGGIKAKVLAAHRAGIARVILPAKNVRDLDDVPEAVREAMDFVLADDMSEVLAAALLPVGAEGATPAGLDRPEAANDRSPHVAA